MLTASEAVAFARALEEAWGARDVRFFSRRLGVTGRARGSFDGVSPIPVLTRPFPSALAEERAEPEGDVEIIFLLGTLEETVSFDATDAYELLARASARHAPAWLVAPFTSPDDGRAPACAPWRAGVAARELCVRVRGADGGMSAGAALCSQDALVVQDTLAETEPLARVLSAAPYAAAARDEESIARLIAHAHAGDCYLANFAHTRVVASRASDAFARPPRASVLLARVLAQRVRFGAHLLSSSGEGVLLTSPERFVRARPGMGEGGGTLLSTEPIKGTARVSSHPRPEDFATLWASEKETAEQILVTDLLRNDLHFICDAGSVAVHEPFFQRIEGTLLQMQTVLSGTAAPGNETPAKFLPALLPPGSVSGTPKKRACEILASLEENPRGYYTGIAGVLTSDGAFDSSVSIRSVFFEKRGVVVGVGGGITSLSDPACECQELALKDASIASFWSAGEKEP